MLAVWHLNVLLIGNYGKCEAEKMLVKQFIPYRIFSMHKILQSLDFFNILFMKTVGLKLLFYSLLDIADHILPDNEKVKHYYS